MKKQENSTKQKGFNFSELTIESNQPPEEITLEYLARLWTTRGKNYEPADAIDQMCADMGAEKFSHLTPAQAMSTYMRCKVLYRKTQHITDFLDQQKRVGKPIIVSNEGMKVGDVEYGAIGGCPEPLKDSEFAARRVADIVSLYTYHSKDIASNAMKSADCKTYRIPFCNIADLRKGFGVQESDYIACRNQIYEKLLDKSTPFLIFYCIHRILSDVSMDEFRTPVSAEVRAWYRKYEKVIPNIRIEGDVMWGFVSKGYKTIGFQDFLKSWQYYQKSVSIRGGSSKKGQMSAGYYSFAVSPSYTRKISEARDVISVLNRHKHYVVQLVDADRQLADLLVANGMSVITSYSTRTYNSKVAGVYGCGCTDPVVIYRAEGAPPSVAEDKVVFSSVMPYANDIEIRSVYLDINMDMRSKILYPSCRPAEGIAMVYYNPNIKNKGAPAYPMNKLLYRFSNAISMRNVFPISRVPYYIKDDHRKCFPNISIPVYKLENDFFTQDMLTECIMESDNIPELGVPKVKSKYDRITVESKVDTLLDKQTRYDKEEYDVIMELFKTDFNFYVMMRPYVGSRTFTNAFSYIYHGSPIKVMNELIDIEKKILNTNGDKLYFTEKTFKAEVKKRTRVKEDLDDDQDEVEEDSVEEKRDKKEEVISVPDELDQADESFFGEKDLTSVDT